MNEIHILFFLVADLLLLISLTCDNLGSVTGCAKSCLSSHYILNIVSCISRCNHFWILYSRWTLNGKGLNENSNCRSLHWTKHELNGSPMAVHSFGAIVSSFMQGFWTFQINGEWQLPFSCLSATIRFTETAETQSRLQARSLHRAKYMSWMAAQWHWCNNFSIFPGFWTFQKRTEWQLPSSCHSLHWNCLKSIRISKTWWLHRTNYLAAQWQCAVWA